MTALKDFERLECPGIWRASPNDQRRDVIVSVGDATLTIADQNEVALSHWSLPAVQRVNPGERPAKFRPGPDAIETLELTDDTMVKAIAKVHSAIERRRPHPGRLRYATIAGTTVAVLALAVFWLPPAMTRYTASVVPAATRIVIGHSLLNNIRRISGVKCSTPTGNQTLAKLHYRMLGNKAGDIAILADGVQLSEHLPGGTILLNRAIVEDYESADVAAGFILAEDARARAVDPMVRLLQKTGLASAFKLLTTGTIPEKYLQEYGEYLLTADQDEVPDQVMLERFAAAEVSATPYAYALDISGETTLPLIEADRVPSTVAKPILTDGEWVMLQGICGE